MWVIHASTCWSKQPTQSRYNASLSERRRYGSTRACDPCRNTNTRFATSYTVSTRASVIPSTSSGRRLIQYKCVVNVGTYKKNKPASSPETRASFTNTSRYRPIDPFSVNHSSRNSRLICSLLTTKHFFPRPGGPLP